MAGEERTTDGPLSSVGSLRRPYLPCVEKHSAPSPGSPHLRVNYCISFFLILNFTPILIDFLALGVTRPVQP